LVADLTGTGNSGTITITSKTGTGKTINNSSPVIITALGTAGTAASFTVGDDPFTLTVNAAAKSDSQITFNSTSQDGSPSLAGSNIGCNLVSNNGNVNLNGMTLLAAATLTSQLNGVTKTDGTGGTFSDFTNSVPPASRPSTRRLRGEWRGHAMPLPMLARVVRHCMVHPDNIYLNDDPMTGVTFDYVNRTFSVAFPTQHRKQHRLLSRRQRPDEQGPWTPSPSRRRRGG
jgi:hypothetical protein